VSQFIRRLLGGGQPSDDAAAPSTEGVAPTEATEPADLDAAERAHELDLLREEQARLDDLAQRQLKYARYSWEPPPQGGERRADDADKAP
jgi:hypothetical protein